MAAPGIAAVLTVILVALVVWGGIAAGQFLGGLLRGGGFLIAGGLVSLSLLVRIAASARSGGAMAAMSSVSRGHSRRPLWCVDRRWYSKPSPMHQRIPRRNCCRMH